MRDPVRTPSKSLVQAKEDPYTCVTKAEEYERATVAAREGRDTFWLSAFADALQLLNSSKPEVPYHPDMLPDLGYSLLARQVIASAVRAYVFGGMGSWNNEPSVAGAAGEGSAVGRALFIAVLTGLLVAANSFQVASGNR